MGIQSIVLISLFFSYAVRGVTGASIYFRTHFAKKMQMCNSIASIIGTNEEHVMVDSRTKFAESLRNMSIYSHKKDQTSVTATG